MCTRLDGGSRAKKKVETQILSFTRCLLPETPPPTRTPTLLRLERSTRLYATEDLVPYPTDRHRLKIFPPNLRRWPILFLHLNGLRSATAPLTPDGSIQRGHRRFGLFHLLAAHADGPRLKRRVRSTIPEARRRRVGGGRADRTGYLPPSSSLKAPPLH